MIMVWYGPNTHATQLDQAEGGLTSFITFHFVSSNEMKGSCRRRAARPGPRHAAPQHSYSPRIAQVDNDTPQRPTRLRAAPSVPTGQRSSGDNPASVFR